MRAVAAVKQRVGALCTHRRFISSSSKPEDWREQCAKVADVLRDAESALFATGAGLSADSGLPTYRGVAGLYNEADTPEGLPIEAALSAGALRSNPALCWKYMGQLEAACRGSQPNAGHRAICAFCSRVPLAVVLTQNVDGLHKAADPGSDAKYLIDIHGDVHLLRCTGRGCRREWAVRDYSDKELSAVGLRPFALGSECLQCDCSRRELVRPDIVLFDEMLPTQKLDRLRGEMDFGFDITFAIGTTGVFPYIQAAVFDGAARRGGLTVEINPVPTILSSSCDIVIRRGAADALSEILRLL